MKVHVYGVFAENRWQFRLSLDLQVDMQYWCLRRKARLLVYGSQQLSMGRAVLWLEAMREEVKTSGGHETSQERIEGLMQARLASITEADPCVMKWLKFVGKEHIEFTEWHPLPEESVAVSIGQLLSGRALLCDEMLNLLTESGLQEVVRQWRRYVQYAYLLNEVELTNGLALEQQRGFWKFKNKAMYRCRRCGSGEDKQYATACAACGEVCRYCEACLTMGRSRFCSLLVLGKPAQIGAAAFATAVPPDLQRWGLSPAQQEASAAAVRFLSLQSAGQLSRAVIPPRTRPASAQNGRAYVSRLGHAEQISEAPDPSAAYQVAEPPSPQSFLIWAVTGAGKTEMIFPLIDFELSRGGQALIATPRRDVVLELQPRLGRAFPQHTLVTLYGGSGQRWEAGDITLATTHQLLRFWRKFDLVVIDEIDAFPFHNDPMLEYAARKVCKPLGKYIFLSATPPAHLQQMARRGKLPHVKVPVRYHRHPLPVPKWIQTKPLRLWPAQKGLPSKLLAVLRASIGRGAQLFVFVPQIKRIDSLVSLLRRSFPDVTIEGTSSKDEGRTDKVQRFRSGEIRLLVTTTILERGVTVPKTDVVILDADSAQFDEASLVQMAGRAGRSKDDPAGNVYFCSEARTRSQTGAAKQIRMMNQLAKSKGYIKS